MRSLSLCATLCALSLLSACGDEAAVIDFCGESELQSLPRDSYPGGPYGTAACSTIDNLELVNTDQSPLTLQALRADPNTQILLVTTSAGWCTACIEEQPELQALHDEFSAKGLAVVVTVFEDQNYQPIDGAYADRWKRQYNLSFTVVADPDKQMHQYYNPELTPMLMLVDAASMKILRIFVGEDPASVRGLIEARLNQ
jgi:peroxiredoxin